MQVWTLKYNETVGFTFQFPSSSTIWISSRSHLLFSFNRRFVSIILSNFIVFCHDFILWTSALNSQLTWYGIHIVFECVHVIMLKGIRCTFACVIFISYVLFWKRDKLKVRNGLHFDERRGTLSLSSIGTYRVPQFAETNIGLLGFAYTRELTLFFFCLF